MAEPFIPSIHPSIMDSICYYLNVIQSAKIRKMQPHLIILSCLLSMKLYNSVPQIC